MIAIYFRLRFISRFSLCHSATALSLSLLIFFIRLRLSLAIRPRALVRFLSIPSRPVFYRFGRAGIYSFDGYEDFR
jgi:hypothetical protein